MSDNKIELHENKEYTKLRPKWEGWTTLYDGEHEKLVDPKYLWLHEYEADESGNTTKDDGKKIRRIREQRSRYLNLIEPIISRWCSFLFRGEWTIPDSVKKIIDEDMMKNIDGKGNSLQSLAKDQIGKYMTLLGKVVAIVDTPGVVANTKATAKSSGLRPYVTVLDPLQAPDWSLSVDPKLYGKPQFFRAQYCREVPRMSELDKPKEQVVSVSYRLNGGAYIQIHYVQKESDKAGGEATWDIEKIINFPQTCTELPVTLFNSQSFVKDAAELQLLLFNYMSAESSMINAQGFRTIFISGEDVEGDREVTLNEYAFNLLAQDAQVTVVEPASTATVEGAIVRCIDWCFKVAFNQVDGLSAMSKESPSADTRRQMKDEFIAMVTDTLTDIENILFSIVSHIAMLKGEAAPTERITIDKTVTDSDYEQELQIWQAFADQFKQIPAINKAMLKRQAMRLNLGDDETIDKEIDAIKDEPEQDAEIANERTSRFKKIANGNEDGDKGATADK